MKKNDTQLTKCFTWLNEQIDNHQFADISITVKLHNGEIRQIQRILNEKIQGGQSNVL